MKTFDSRNLNVTVSLIAASEGDFSSGLESVSYSEETAAESRNSLYHVISEDWRPSMKEGVSTLWFSNAKICTLLFLESHLMLFKSKTFPRVVWFCSFPVKVSGNKCNVSFFLRAKYAFRLCYAVFCKIYIACLSNMQKILFIIFRGQFACPLHTLWALSTGCLWQWLLGW